MARLRVSPRAKRTGIGGEYGEDGLRLAGAAPAVNGKANAEVEVVHGSSSGDKTVFVGGIGVVKVRELLSGEVR